MLWEKYVTAHTLKLFNAHTGEILPPPKERCSFFCPLPLKFSLAEIPEADYRPLPLEFSLAEILPTGDCIQSRPIKFTSHPWAEILRTGRGSGHPQFVSWPLGASEGGV